MKERIGSDVEKKIGERGEMAQRQKGKRHIKDRQRYKQEKLENMLVEKNWPFQFRRIQTSVCQGVRTTLLRVTGIKANCLLQHCKAHM